jgi:hypothetical protein
LGEGQLHDADSVEKFPPILPIRRPALPPLLQLYRRSSGIDNEHDDEDENDGIILVEDSRSGPNTGRSSEVAE